MVWDIKKNMEHAFFTSRSKDRTVGHINGLASDLGYLVFDNYIVNLDDSLPIPFLKTGIRYTQENTHQGCLIDDEEEIIIING